MSQPIDSSYDMCDLPSGIPNHNQANDAISPNSTFNFSSSDQDNVQNNRNIETFSASQVYSASAQFADLDNDDREEVLEQTQGAHYDISVELAKDFGTTQTSKIAKLKSKFKQIQSMIMDVPKKIKDLKEQTSLTLGEISFYLTMLSIRDALKPARLVLDGLSEAGQKLLLSLQNMLTRSKNDSNSVELIEEAEDESIEEKTRSVGELRKIFEDNDEPILDLSEDQGVSNDIFVEVHKGSSKKSNKSHGNVRISVFLNDDQ